MKTLNKSERQDFLKTEGKINSKLVRKKKPRFGWDLKR